MTSSICVHGIIRNEAFTIKRMLDSVRHFVTEYYFVDTGSTDNTLKVLESDAMPGNVSVIPFTDFSTTRNHALSVLQTSCEWVMLMDADMTFHGNLPSLFQGDVVRMIHYRKGLRYLRTVFFRRNHKVHYEGKTHEILVYPPTSESHIIPESEAWINDGGDGGNVAEKLQRDLGLLVSSKNTAREVFYLAETYRYLSKTPLAIETYKRRFNMGGGNTEELFYSCYQIGRLYLSDNKEAEARYWMDRSLSYNSKRCEPHYHLACWASSRQKWVNANTDIVRSLMISPSEPPTDGLFVEVDVYQFLRYYQHIVIGYYSGSLQREVCLQQMVKLLDESTKEWRSRVHNFIARLVHRVVLCEILFHRSYELKEGWMWSTPTFVDDITLVRSNNYYISENGEYIWDNPEYSECRVYAITGNELSEEEVEREPGGLKIFSGRRVRGLEDVRLFRWKNSYIFTAVVEDMVSVEKRRRMVLGVYDKKLKVEHLMDSPYGKDCEKNWSLFEVDDGVLRCVYRWWPLEEGVVEEGRLINLRESTQPLPGIFYFMRGSTHGQYYHDAVWFITHSVAFLEGRRNYLHYCVALSPKTFGVVGHSLPFRFTDGPVEFCNGFSIVKGLVKIGFSRNDCSTTIVTDDFYSFLGMVGFRFL